MLIYFICPNKRPHAEVRNRFSLFPFATHCVVYTLTWLIHLSIIYDSFEINENELRYIVTAVQIVKFINGVNISVSNFFLNYFDSRVKKNFTRRNRIEIIFLWWHSSGIGFRSRRFRRTVGFYVFARTRSPHRYKMPGW